jgi:hypothetical protein
MSVWDWFPTWLWPITFLYALLGALIVLRITKNSNARQTLAGALAFPAILIEGYLIHDSSQSLMLLFDFYFGFVVAGACACLGFFLVYFSKWTVASRPGALTLFGLIGPALLFYGANALIQDYALTRLVVEGTVGGLDVVSWSRRAPEYQVTIGIKTFWTTPRTFKALKVGDHIRAEVGRGSQYIFKIENVASNG